MPPVGAAKTQTRGERAFEVAQGLTVFWFLVGAVTVWPYPIAANYKPAFVVLGVTAPVAWWFAIPSFAKLARLASGSRS